MAENDHRAVSRWRPDARIAGILAATAVATLAHANVPAEYPFLGKLIQYLYFLPTLLAALWFGWRGALASAALTALCYRPRLLLFWGPDSYPVAQLGQVFDLFLIGGVVGILTDRDRRQRHELEATTRQLRQTYREMQNNFEHLKRVERLSAIGQMAAGLAHEIRNPLASIEGAADLLTPGAVDETLRQEFVDIIKKECHRLSRLLTQMLDFARPRTPQYQPTSLSALIQDVTGLVGVFAQGSGVEIEVVIESSLPSIECDPEQIKQVLLNLAVNGVQTMAAGGRLTLAASRRAANVVVEVKDEGSGIAQDDFDKVFSPFFTTKKDGTGLGLPVAQQIVVRHGGVIMVDPNTPRGMIFTIVLPLERGRAAA